MAEDRQRKGCLIAAGETVVILPEDFNRDTHHSTLKEIEGCIFKYSR